ncbi:MAG TPA: methyltransferase domain-containing protein [Thermoanaerobaculia bacterium]|nr:methyltransferase domain-containing protein [Thermoanaerobaculia bacterium]
MRFRPQFIQEAPVPVTILCTVRNCRLPLAREARQLVCPRRHSFDIARSGYANLLQPQDRRSRRPGDALEAVAARRRLADEGHAEPLVRGLLEILVPLGLGESDAVLDAGCGEGHHLGAIAGAFGIEAHGVDLSVSAIDLAARRHRSCHWIVANADRFLPYAEASFRLLTSITSRMNAAEFRRVLRDDGRLVVVIPGPDDLVELRSAVLGAGELRDRTARTIETFAADFALERQEGLRHIAHLDKTSITGAMTASYRALRLRERQRLEALSEMDVTLSWDVLVFKPVRRLKFA